MNKILLITTIGCEGCKIQDRIIQEALKDIDGVSYEKHDEYFLTDKVKKQYAINDYPATLFIRTKPNKHDEILKKIIGTTTKQDIINKIKDMFFS